MTPTRLELRLSPLDDAAGLPHVFEAPLRRWLGGLPADAPTAPLDASRDDQRRLLELAIAQNLAPYLLYRARERGLADELPGWLTDELARASQAAAVRLLRIQPRLENLLGACHRDGVEIALLKGIAHAFDLYPQPALRPMVDVDLLVRPSGVDAAVAVFERLGFVATPNVMWREFAYHINFDDRQPTGLHLELHWRLSDRAALSERPPTADLWRRAVPAGKAFPTAWRLSDIDAALHGLIHIVSHRGATHLGRLADLRLLLARIAGDAAHWHRLAEQVEANDLGAVFEATLDALAYWFGFFAPHAERRVQRADRLARSEQRIVALCRRRGPLSAAFEELRSHASLRQSARFLASHAFPPPAWMRHRFATNSTLGTMLGYPRRWLTSMAGVLNSRL